MPKTSFINRFLDRLDRLDRLSVRNLFLKLEAEKNFSQEILEELPEAVLVLDPQGHFLYVNRIARLFLGIGQNQNVAGRPIEDLVRDYEFRFLLREKLGEHKQLLSEEIMLLEPHERLLNVSITPLHNQDGAYCGNIILASDVAYLRERDRQKARLERIETLTSLASGIAHEIGNPLNSIGIHIDLIKRKINELPKTKKRDISEYIDVLERETKRLNRMVKNFLQATRRKPIVLKKDNINRILMDALKLFELEMKQQNIELQIKLNRRIPAFFIDTEKLRQAFVNLIRNAIQSMPNGGTLTVKTDQKERLCLISIKDDGCGIPEENADRIFEAYYTTKEEGSGLGLSIVYNIVREHGGRINVQSMAGKGTEITVVLPMRREKLQLPLKKK